MNAQVKSLKINSKLDKMDINHLRKKVTQGGKEASASRSKILALEKKIGTMNGKVQKYEMDLSAAQAKLSCTSSKSNT